MKGLGLRLVCGSAAALVFHLVMGWAWTIVAAIGVGFWQERGGWLAGAVSVGLSFVLLIAHSWLVAPGAVARLGTVMGAMFYGMPAPLIFVGTALTGILIGIAGGGLGSGVRRLIK